MKLIDANKLKEEFIKTCGAVPFVYDRSGETVYIDKLINEQPQVHLSVNLCTEDGQIIKNIKFE